LPLSAGGRHGAGGSFASQHPVARAQVSGGYRCALVVLRTNRHGDRRRNVVSQRPDDGGRRSRRGRAGFRSRAEAKRSERHGKGRDRASRLDLGDDGHSGQQRIVVVRGRENYDVGYDVLDDLRLFANLPDCRFELVAGKPIDRKLDWLPDRDLRDVALVDTGMDLHAAEIAGDDE